MFNQLSSLMKASVYYVIALGLAVVVAALVALVPGLVEYSGPKNLHSQSTRVR